MSSLPLSTAELAQMRGVADTYLAGTAILHAPTKTADGQGGYTWTYTASGTVDARLSPERQRAGGEVGAGSRLAEVSPWILTIPASTSIGEDWRVVYASVTYEVSEVLTWTPWEISRRVRVTEVD